MSGARRHRPHHDCGAVLRLPERKTPRLSVREPRCGVALVVCLLASVAFAFYVANFGSYNKTYGTLAGVIAFLVWLWLTNVALLLGAELNAERERSIELQDGVEGADWEIQLESRSAPKDQART